MSEISKFADDFVSLCKANANKQLVRFVLETGKKDYSYEDIMNYTKKYISFFKSKGLKKGDTVVTILPNSVECIVAFFAAIAGGYNFAPLSCQVTEREFRNWVNIVKPSLVIRKSGICEFESFIETFECECDGDLSWLPSRGGEFDSSLNPKVYLMTSGTTGSPKAMAIDANKLWSSGKAFSNFYQISEKAVRFWNYLPMSYLGGLYNLALIPLCCGGSFVISEPFSGKTILNYWSFVESNEIDALWLVPSIMQGLLKIAKLVGKGKGGRQHKEIRIAFLGTAPVQLKQKEEFESVFGIRLYENFALSESTFLTAENEENIRFREQGSVGAVLPYVSLKMIPVEGIENTNVIWIKSPFLFDGYLDENGMVDLELDEEGYFNSKDLGYFNPDNIMVLVGRNRDIIKKGGLFVSLVEVENVVKQYPAVDDVVAVPVKSDFYGESFVICVIFKPEIDEENEKEKLHVWLIDNIVKYKVPERIYIYKDFPRTASGKIQKNKIAYELENKNEK